MDPRQDTVAELYNRVEGRFWDTAIDEDIKDWANRQLAAVQTEIDLVVRGRQGYLDFLLTHIGREHARFTVDDLGRSPYDERREAALCTCHDRCALSQGRIPGAIRHADDVERAILAWKHEHSGDPIVLDHNGDPPGARQQWSELRNEVLFVLRRAESYLHRHRDDPPDDGVLTVGGSPDDQPLASD